jgi:hypothetical protein
MKSKARFLTAAMMAVTLAACSDDGTGPDGNTGNSMEATVAGEAAFDPQSPFIQGSYVNNTFTLVASQTSGGKTISIQINVLNVTAAGVYQLNPNFTGQFGQVSVIQGTSAPTWSTILSPGTGSINITTLTADRAAGTFQFTGQAVQSTPATGQKAVTSGTFDVEI